VFDPTSPLKNGATSKIYVGVADTNSSTWVSTDAGATWTAMAGQPTGVFPHKMKFSIPEKHCIFLTTASLVPTVPDLVTSIESHQTGHSQISHHHGLLPMASRLDMED
jgi:hypothetical protein